MIRDARLADAEKICNIYNYYIKNTNITFEEATVTEKEMEERIKGITKNYPWLVYEEDGVILGYAYASRWKDRKAYDFSVESSVYVDCNTGCRGIGSALYKALIEKLGKINVHAVIGGVALPNEPSQRLHEKLGFKEVARFLEVGYKFGKWIDVGYWQLNIKNC